MVLEANHAKFFTISKSKNNVTQICAEFPLLPQTVQQSYVAVWAEKFIGILGQATFDENDTSFIIHGAGGTPAPKAKVSLYRHTTNTHIHIDTNCLQLICDTMHLCQHNMADPTHGTRDKNKSDTVDRIIAELDKAYECWAVYLLPETANILNLMRGKPKDAAPE